MRADRVDAQNEDQFLEAFGLLLELHEESGFAALNIDKAIRDSYTVMSQGMSFVVREALGKDAVGIVTITEEGFAYADETLLATKQLYVRPDYRAGPAFKALLEAAKAVAESRNKQLFIQISNPRRKPSRSGLVRVAEGLGYAPRGYTLQVTTKESKEHG
ncbi:MAG: hypothetical protein ACRECF_06980 [Methyloceanibacter sp.]